MPVCMYVCMRMHQCKQIPYNMYRCIHVCIRHVAYKMRIQQRDALPRRRNTQAHKETLYRGAEIQSPAAAVGQESEEIALKKLAHIAHAHVVALG